VVQRLWKSVQQILRYFGSNRKSPLRPKIGWHGNGPLRNQKRRIEKINANAFHLVKNNENRSSKSWDSFAHVKKEEINAKCAERAKSQNTFKYDSGYVGLRIKFRYSIWFDLQIMAI